MWTKITGVESPTTCDLGVLVAVPGVQDGHINVTSLPSERRVGTIPAPQDVKTGMVMAIGLRYSKGRLSVTAGYESGHAAVWQQNERSGLWQTVYVNKAHSQPILSLDICEKLECFFTSSADAVIAQHPLPGSDANTKHVQTKHAGQQSLRVRPDQKIFATAGWDGRARVYSTKNSKELAVLKWHKEGCYALAFAGFNVPIETPENNQNEEQAIVEKRLTVSDQRTQKAQSTHWLALGSKDGKVSLWDVY